MKTIETQVPDSVYQQASELAAKEQMPLGQLVSMALAQALGAWKTESIIAERAKRGSREKFLAVMAKVPHVEPPEEDRWP